MEDQKLADAAWAKAQAEAEAAQLATDTTPHTTAVAKLLDALPGLVGGIDRAIIEKTGIKAPFVLVLFAEGSAMHATNITPPQQAQAAIIELARAWEKEGTEHTPL